MPKSTQKHIKSTHMKIDTTGKPIIELDLTCGCGLTAGCERCSPRLFEIKLYRTIEEFINCQS